MKDLNAWWISVFADEKLQMLGNVSVVVYLANPLERKNMQRIANDMNQPATTFIWQDGADWNIRWFAPDAEIPLCGHGTMAAVALFDHLKKDIPTFKYADGQVGGFTENAKVFSELERGDFEISPAPAGLEDALGVEIAEHYTSSDKNIVLLNSEKDLRAMQPNFDTLKQLKPFGYAVTAKGEAVDFVSRTLVPKVQQREDHATGSSHTVLVPFWSARLNKNQFVATQLSRRGGKFQCRLTIDCVVLGGDYKVVGEGVIRV
ncbi:MAG: PhzF family phenazine biosynthesis protein [Bacteroidota bacterium]